ncbi:MAG: helix-turn-helix transcriptional regulator [Clostridia bacterium]|nr:helix-turn-helix transcriptional regulator [Clostridia bacterium]
MFNSIEVKFCDRRIVDKTWWCVAKPSFRPIFHIGQNRLHYVHSGSPTIYCDEKPYTLEPGKLYLFPQNLSFRGEVADGTEYDHTALDFLTFPPVHMSKPLEISLSASPLLQPATEICAKLIALHPMARYGTRNEYSPLIESYGMNLLKLIHEVYPIETISDPFITDILNYIHENYYKELRLEELSARTNYQKHFFIRKFKQIMGVPPYKYIKDYRMSTAFYLIQTGKFSIAQVAERVGYSDTSGFSHAFKQQFGIYPNEVSKTVFL